jgi:NAD(P)-dependent dehydrogenase (short-subunit alcohol dehydrogenase family)
LYPLRRQPCTPDIAPCIVFLASEDASFITGYCMPVDGGMGLVSQEHVI